MAKVLWRCKFCRDKKYIYVQKYVNGFLMYCPKPCTCTVISHAEIDAYNSMRDNDDAEVLRFPIEKVTASTKKEREGNKVLSFYEFAMRDNEEENENKE
jgi:hypothetical protein